MYQLLNLKKNDYLENPLLKMETNIRLKLSRLPFLKNQLVPIHAKPP